MTQQEKNEMQISEAELRSMTADLEEMHEATFPVLASQPARPRRQHPHEDGRARWPQRPPVAPSSPAAASWPAASCSPPAAAATPATPAATGDPTSDTGSGAGDDKAALKTNASLEALAVFAYGAALKAAPMGKFGKTVPAAVAEFATVAKKQHKDHPDAFNAALDRAGGTAFTEPDPALAGPVTEMFGERQPRVGLAKLALTLENTAAATYIKQMAELTSPEALVRGRDHRSGGAPALGDPELRAGRVPGPGHVREAGQDRDLAGRPPEHRAG